MIKTILSALLACAALLGGQTALAQTFPTRPVTIISPFPPGDIVARGSSRACRRSSGNR